MAEWSQDRVVLHRDLDIIEVDFSDLRMACAEDADAIYDQMDRIISTSGQGKWFFLVNYRNCRIMPDAWLTHAARGKRLNVTHSLNTVRYDASPETSAQISRSADTANFDANLFDNRDDAIARVVELHRMLPETAFERATGLGGSPRFDAGTRIGFHPDTGIVDIDFSDISFATSRDVDMVCDAFEREFARQDRESWYFLINYRNCRIDLSAGIAFDERARQLSATRSVAAARYAASADLEEHIRILAKRLNRPANIFETRDEALACLLELAASRHGQVVAAGE